jgi:multiple sugar transport system substrate-binding protein
MRSNIAGGSVPDVFYTTTTMAPQYIPTGKLLNLSPYMARDNVSPDSYYPSLLKPFTCKDGVVYGLVKDWNSLGVFYNKQLFQKAGVPFPSANWTWDDLRADAQKLTKAGNVATSQYGLTLPANASTWGAFLYAAGGSVLNKDGTKATFNSPEGIRSLSFYAGLQRDGYSVMPGQVGAGWGGEAFGKQRVAMDFEGGWAIPFLASTYPNVQYGIAPVPIDSTTDKRGDLIFVNSWGAYAQTQHPEAAWELVKYMTGIDVQTSQLNAGFALPGLQSLADAPYFKSHPDFKVLFDASSYSIPDNYGPHDGVIHQKLAQALESVMLGKSDAQTALNTAARQVDNELQA